MNIPNKTYRYNNICVTVLKLNRILSDLAGIIPVLFCHFFLIPVIPTLIIVGVNGMVFDAGVNPEILNSSTRKG